MILQKIEARFFNAFKQLSLELAAKEQGLAALRKQLSDLIPDITNQYSMFKVDTEYLAIKVRNLHAFQISLVTSVLEGVRKAVIVDIGDSAGTHLKYLSLLYAGSKDLTCVGVNLDPKAVERIKNRGLQAVNARAEELEKYNIQPDIFLCFEMLEHLTDPCRFLHELSSKTKARHLIFTVPYVRHSRVGLHHIRENRHDTVCAENTHIFELCPHDWKLLANHAGWNVVSDKIYFQYPRKGFLSIIGSLWRRYDFEGFYGIVLSRDESWSSNYRDW